MILQTNHYFMTWQYKALRRKQEQERPALSTTDYGPEMSITIAWT